MDTVGWNLGVLSKNAYCLSSENKKDKKIMKSRRQIFILIVYLLFLPSPTPHTLCLVTNVEIGTSEVIGNNSEP